MVYKHTAIYLGGRVVPTLINLVATAIFTRLAAPVEYSVLVLALSSAAIGSAALFQWLRMSILRYSGGEDSRDVVGTITRLYLIQGAISAAVLLLASIGCAVLGVNYLLVLVCGLMILAQSWFDYTQELQRAALQPLSYSISFASRAVLALLLGGGALYVTGSGYALVAGVGIAFIIAPLPFLKSAFGRPNFAPNPQLARSILRYGLPLAVALALNNIAVQGDRFLVAILINKTAAGLYGPAVELGRQSIFTLLQSVTLACYPLAIRALRSEGVEAAVRQMAINFEILIAVALPASAGLALLRVEIAQVMLGAEFRSVAITLFPLVAISTFLLSINTFYFIQGNQLGEKTGGQAIVAVIAAIGSIILNLLLIPQAGLLGAAVAAVLAQTLSLACSVYISRQSFPLPVPLPAIARAVGATGLMAATILLAQWVLPSGDALRFVYLVFIAGCSYAAGILIFDVCSARHFLRKRLQFAV